MSLDDERVRFYLRHRDQIEQWAALRAATAEAMDDWLTALAPDVEELSRQLGPDVVMDSVLDVDANFPRYRLRRKHWPAATEPDVYLGLEWWRGHVYCRGTNAPYVGVKSLKATPIGVALRASEPLQKARRARGQITNEWWPAYGCVLPPPTFPEDEDSYRAVLIQAYREAWRTYAPLVDELVKPAG